MATLRDKVNTTLIRRNGQLVEEANPRGMAPPTPTSQLAGQAGLVAPPTSPAGVGAIGGTPKQQDMAGSGAQKSNALRQSLDTSNTLQEAEADKRYRSAMTAEEQAESQKQKRLGEVFGSTQQKVQDLINAQMNVQPAVAAPTLQAPGGLTAQAGLADTLLGNIQVSANPQEDVDHMWGLLTGYLNGGRASNDPDVVSAINRLAGLTGQTTDQISQSAADAAQKQIQSGTGAAAANAIAGPGAANVSALLPSLGTNRDELAQLLGINPGVVDTLTLDQLDELVGGISPQGADLSTAETEAAAQSGLSGAAERAAMRERSRELSTSGVAASEAQLEQLGHSLANADQVQFGGRTWTTEELLRDDTISQMVSDYLMAPEGSEIRKSLEGDPNAAGLLSFINKYQDALTDAAKSIGSAATAATGIQEANSKLSSVGGFQLPDSVMSNIYGDKWGTPQASELQSTGLVQAIGELGTQADKFREPLNTMLAEAKADPALARDIAGMNAAQLTAMFTPDSSGKSKWDNLTETKMRKADLEANKDNVDSMLALYFGDPSMNMDKFNQLWAEDKKLSANGVPHSPAFANLGLKDNGYWNEGGGYGDAAAASTLYKLVSQGLSRNDTPTEALGTSNSAGWTAPSIQHDQKAVARAEERQKKIKEAKDHHTAIEQYLAGQKGLSAQKKQDIMKREMSWYVANGYYGGKV